MSTMQYFYAAVLVALSVFIYSAESSPLTNRVRRDLVIPREFQNINIEGYLKNKRAVKFQINCLLEVGPCDRIGKYMKSMIPEVIETQCANCPRNQKDLAVKVFNYMQENFSNEMEQAILKYNNGDLVKAEDAKKLEDELGVKLLPQLIAPPTATAESEQAEVKIEEIDTPTTTDASISQDQVESETTEKKP